MANPPPNSAHPLTRLEWRAWLTENHERAEGVWLVSFKKATGKSRFDYGEAVEEALCFGWIDSRPNKLDDERSLLWFALRKTGTGWSRPNKERIMRMTELGQMFPAGLKKIEATKADGSWSALDEVENLVIPHDLQVSLNSYPNAAKNFSDFPRSAKRGILEWVAQARTEATRSKRIFETASLAQLNKRANQWTGPK